jgi:hypothetical protein
MLAAVVAESDTNNVPVKWQKLASSLVTNADYRRSLDRLIILNRGKLLESSKVFRAPDLD